MYRATTKRLVHEIHYTHLRSTERTNDSGFVTTWSTRDSHDSLFGFSERTNRLQFCFFFDRFVYTMSACERVSRYEVRQEEKYSSEIFTRISFIIHGDQLLNLQNPNFRHPSIRWFKKEIRKMLFVVLIGLFTICFPNDADPEWIKPKML